MSDNTDPPTGEECICTYWEGVKQVDVECPQHGATTLVASEVKPEGEKERRSEGERRIQGPVGGATDRRHARRRSRNALAFQPPAALEPVDSSDKAEPTITGRDIMNEWGMTRIGDEKRWNPFWLAPWSDLPADERKLLTNIAAAEAHRRNKATEPTEAEEEFPHRAMGASIADYGKDPSDDIPPLT